MFFRCAPHAPNTEQGHAVTLKRGRTFKTVDIHCHVQVPEVRALLEQVPVDARPPGPAQTNPLSVRIDRDMNQNVLPNLTDTALRLADMDRQGIDIQALSPSPYHFDYGYPAEVARQTAHIVNDRIAEIVASHPDRFVGMGTLPLQDAAMAVAELDRCVKDLGLRGVEISTNVNGRDLTRAGLESFFARAEELDTLVFIHPRGTSFTERMTDYHFRNLIGHPLESALAVGHLVFDGYLERYPGLKICIAHGGGYIPAYSGRFDHAFALREDCRENITQPPSAYIKKLYFDTVVFTEHQLRHMIEVWGADHVVLGTDYPYDMAETDPVGHIESVHGLGDAEAELIMGGNAARLLKLD